ncbi:hypothetical protein [Streptomyces johnsoniae]|uniref:Nudix hydrolase domain-containing protein n=1 Tax=Streptomyces johnsoniae TaxID=3075532 RepID=A0ABU2S9C4_9ACTN|nr:hypothetical protein [Streptomyces sp. DSM 41886]MDT0445583.1 hypothetical protein [Streptomyces sp. DSM 41886]
MHDDDGRFLMGRKNVNGHFFLSGSAILRQGQRLNGSGLNALPGGALEDEDLAAAAGNLYAAVRTGAMREMREELNFTCEGYQGYRMWTMGNTRYYGAFFRCANPKFMVVHCAQANVALRNAKNAVTEIKQGTITDYTRFRERFPLAPLDNELDTVEIWNVNTHWPTIAGWRNDQNLSWFFDILHELKEPSGRLVTGAMAAGSSMPG